MPIGTLTTELLATVGDSHVWIAVAAGLLLFAVCTFTGIVIARGVGLLQANAFVGDTIGVGLATGMIVVAVSWATIRSGGRSSFTPVAIGLLISATGAVLTRKHRHHDQGQLSAPDETASPSTISTTNWRIAALALLSCAAFLIVIAVVYGATMAPSPRDGVQPIEFMDEDFYAVLSKDLSGTGTETILSPSGFSDISGMPSQDWYHWGEIWLGSAVISLAGLEPIGVRHFVVLPLLLLAASILTGSVVRRLTRSPASTGFAFGAAACLFLAPVPAVLGAYFASRAVGLIFGITTYGLAAVAVLLVFVVAFIPAPPRQRWPLTAFVACLMAFVLPAHIVVAGLAAVFGGSLVGVRAWRQRVLHHPLEAIPARWRTTAVVLAVLVGATVVWGLLTGHGIPATAASSRVQAFSHDWQLSVASVVLGGLAFYAIAIDGFLSRRTAPFRLDLYFAAILTLVFAGLAWGARLGDFNMFHVFFGAIAVFLMPFAATAIWALWSYARQSGRHLIGIAFGVLVIVQMEAGVIFGIARLQEFGPHAYAPVSTSFLQEVRSLPPGNIAYACAPAEEISYWVPRLIAIGVHANRRIIPMCFEADFLSVLLGAEPTTDFESPLFRSAPQRALFPTSTAVPDRHALSEFLRAHGVAYLYADAAHPNTLLPGATTLIRSGSAEILRVP